MLTMEPFNKDQENPTKKKKVGLNSLIIILMSVEIKSSIALCCIGYFTDWISEGRIYEDFQLCCWGG